MPHPTQEPSLTVSVYSFRPLADGWETTRVAPFKATREAIAALFIGDVLEGTGERVSPEEVDALGRWRRVQTAWRNLS